MGTIWKWLRDLLGLAVCALRGHAGELIGTHYVRGVFVYRCSRCGNVWEDEE